MDITNITWLIVGISYEGILQRDKHQIRSAILPPPPPPPQRLVPGHLQETERVMRHRRPHRVSSALGGSRPPNYLLSFLQKTRACCGPIRFLCI